MSDKIINQELGGGGILFEFIIIHGILIILKAQNWNLFLLSN